jgi:N-acetyl-anhydromuramyl-L-alanine amidase AmpD
MMKVKFITIHCSASPPNVFVDKATITRWHRAKGWVTIGYHYVIGRDGTVETGRSETTTGAHVAGYNKDNLGICLVGGVNERGKATNNFTPNQFDSLVQLLKELKGRYPHAEILGHRDWPNVAKDCPSFDVKSWLNKQVI